MKTFHELSNFSIKIDKISQTLSSSLWDEKDRGNFSYPTLMSSGDLLSVAVHLFTDSGNDAQWCHISDRAATFSLTRWSEGRRGVQSFSGPTAFHGSSAPVYVSTGFSGRPSNGIITFQYKAKSSPSLRVSDEDYNKMLIELKKAEECGNIQDIYNTVIQCQKFGFPKDNIEKILSKAFLHLQSHSDVETLTCLLRLSAY